VACHGERVTAGAHGERAAIDIGGEIHASRRVIMPAVSAAIVTVANVADRVVYPVDHMRGVIATGAAPGTGSSSLPISLLLAPDSGKRRPKRSQRPA
jgi:hypothetical protein